MAKQTWVNVNGAWKKVKSVWVNINGVWKKDVMPKGVVQGNWKEFMSYAFDGFVLKKSNRLYVFEKNGLEYSNIPLPNSNTIPSLNSNGEIHYNSNRNAYRYTKEGDLISQVTFNPNEQDSYTLYSRPGVNNNGDMFIAWTKGSNTYTSVVRADGNISNSQNPLHKEYGVSRITAYGSYAGSGSYFFVVAWDSEADNHYVHCISKSTANESSSDKTYLGTATREEIFITGSARTPEYFIKSGRDIMLIRKSESLHAPTRTYIHSTNFGNILDMCVTHDFIYILTSENKVCKLTKSNTKQGSTLISTLSVNNGAYGLNILKNGEICVMHSSGFSLYDNHGALIFNNTTTGWDMGIKIYEAENIGYYND